MKSKEPQILRLERGKSTSEGTAGRLSLNGQFVCYMLELPARQNASNISRIPAGRYTVRHLPRSGSGKYRDVYHVINVPNRFGILIHQGNFAGDRQQGYKTHSWGCLLPAKRLGTLSGQLAGLASRSALKTLHKAVDRQTFILEIT